MLVVDRFLIAVGTAFLLLLAMAFALKVSSTFSRAWFVSFCISSVSVTFALRFCSSWFVGRLSDIGVLTRNVVILGCGEQGARFLSHARSRGARFMSILGVFDDRTEPRQSVVEGFPVLGGAGDLIAFVRSNQVDDVFIALPWSADKRLEELISRLRELPVGVYLTSDLIGFRLAFRDTPSHYSDVPVFQVTGPPLTGWDVLFKTAEDYIGSFILITLLSPFLLFVAFVIKLESPGPVLFRQKRFGFNNKVFEIYKFRTMRHSPVPETTTIQARQNDPRVTRIGHFLRRTSVDELPQLINVLKGTMSLVGPRPHALDHNEDYARRIRGYFARHRVKPGITGLAQVRGFRGPTEAIEKMEARVRYDVEYAENWSLVLDLRILLATIVACIRGRNAY
jgi:Undecaprenyl-phosphate glucose phosphotransferase